MAVVADPTQIEHEIAVPDNLGHRPGDEHAAVKGRSGGGPWISIHNAPYEQESRRDLYEGCGK